MTCSSIFIESQPKPNTHEARLYPEHHVLSKHGQRKVCNGQLHGPTALLAVTNEACHGVAWLTSRQAHHRIHQHNCKGCISWVLSWVMPGQGMGLLTQNVIDAKIVLCCMWVLLQAACVQRHTTCGVHVWCSQMLQLRQSVRTCRQSHGAAAL